MMRYLDTGSPLNLQSPLLANVGSLWLPGIGSQGTPFRDLMRRRNGTIVTAVRAGAMNAPGAFGSVHLNRGGTDNAEHISIVSGSNILCNLANASIVAYFRTNNATAGDAAGDPLWTERSAGGPIWKFLALNDGASGTPFTRLQFVHRDNANTLTRVTGNIPVVQRNVVGGMTKIGTAVSIYADGLFDNSGTLGGNDTLTVTDVRLGDDAADPGTFFQGRLYALAIFPNVSLTAQQHRAWHDELKAGCPNVLNWRRFPAYSSEAAVGGGGSLLLRLQTEGLFVGSGGMAA